jgi:2-keto-4-pentenoate hydratase/2-oxohepta-3-ene-1,7-dioic acid hydratase in catechol pathway
MKIVRFLDAGLPAWGCISDESIVRLKGNPFDRPKPGKSAGPVGSLKLLAPCQPRKIVGVGINYPGATGLTDTMTEPLVFLKAGTSVCGSRDEIVSTLAGTRIWGECELAFVVGPGSSIFGYTAANDVTADNIEGWDHHLARSKAADTFCPLGPWIDTEYSAENREIQGFQNGELIRRGNSNDRLWQDAQILAWLSTWMTLEPWDVILTGAPTRIVPRRYLNDGDEFVVRIEGLGELRNRFRERRTQ